MFVVRVADNFHYADEEEAYTHSEHETWEAAVATARRLVDLSLAEHYHPGMSAQALYGWYVAFGDDPYIASPPPGEAFSAWDYARQRCAMLCVPPPA